MGNDSAFRLERKSDLDYIHAATVEDAVNGIRKLQNSAELRTAILENGKIRSQEIQSTLAKKWRYFLINTAFPAYDEWTYQSEYKRRFFVFARSIGLAIKSQLSRQLGLLKHEEKAMRINYFDGTQSEFYKARNFGDELNPWLWPKVFPEILKTRDEVDFIGIGTIDLLGNKG